MKFECNSIKFPIPLWYYKGGGGQKEGRKRYYCEMWNIKIDKMAKVVFQGNMISTDYIGFHILFYFFIFFISFFFVQWHRKVLKFGGDKLLNLIKNWGNLLGQMNDLLKWKLEILSKSGGDNSSCSHLIRYPCCVWCDAWKWRFLTWDDQWIRRLYYTLYFHAFCALYKLRGDTWKHNIYT